MLVRRLNPLRAVIDLPLIPIYRLQVEGSPLCCPGISALCCARFPLCAPGSSPPSPTRARRRRLFVPTSSMHECSHGRRLVHPLGADRLVSSHAPIVPRPALWIGHHDGSDTWPTPARSTWVQARRARVMEQAP